MTYVVLAVVLVVIGLVLILAEALLPSGGLLTLMAVASAGAGIVVGFTLVEGKTFGVVLLVSAVVVGPFIFLFGLSRLPKTRFGKRLVLFGEPTLRGYTEEKGEPHYEGLLGKEGAAVSVLRPAGVAEFDGQRYDVVSEGPMIPQGTRVKVILVEANRLVVRAAEEGDSRPPA